MAETFLDECIAILERGPATLNVLLRDLPATWTQATEGEGTWSPHIVIAHLIHGERTDWMTRVAIILEHGPRRTFDPFVRELEMGPESLPELLDEFVRLRQENLVRLRALSLRAEDLALVGMHPALGEVTLRQLIATWTAHDLAHILQVSRVMARRLRGEVGPWAEYQSVMR